MLSNIADAASAKFISLAIKELGNPPCQFAFLALGSHGRQEQTLFTDQDNCIIYEDTPHNAEQIANYFSSLSASVCSNLVLAGYRECKGKIMANNPEWCKPLQTWKKYFSEWIKKGDGHELMEFSVFFDFRTVYGDALLASNLREHVFGELSRSVVFYPQVAKNALAFKTPMRLFGTIIGKTGEAVRSGQLDLKTAAMPIVSFARLYSLKSNLSETNTLSRLDTLSRKGIILPSQQQNIATAWESLLRLRLRHQSNSLDRGVSPDNIVDPSWLGHIEEALLNECFKEIDLIQNQIRRDFLGGENI
jgi:CBS domain-containing protein